MDAFNTLNIIKQILMLLFAVTIHELAHVFVAKQLGVKTEKIMFTPLGEVAIMKDLVFLQPHEKAAVILAGPFSNVLIGLVLLCFFPNQFVTFRETNFVIGFFNLMPTYPLDGGRLCVLWLERRLGLLPSNNIMLMVSKVVGGCFVLLGFVQVILYPLNVSLICMGLYTAYCTKKQHFDTAFDFYKHVMLGHSKHLYKRKLIVKIFALPPQTRIKKIVKMLGYDTFLVFYIVQEGEKLQIITEKEVIAYVKHNGMGGALISVCKTATIDV